MKKREKGFTLIELLVVVAIIGALAAVGVVAYNGYTAAAKKNSSKAIHANAVKYIASELANVTWMIHQRFLEELVLLIAILMQKQL